MRRRRLLNAVARKLYPYLDRETNHPDILGALHLVELVGPNLSAAEAGRMEFLTRRWLLDGYAQIRSFAADVYAALPPESFSSKEWAFRIVSWLVADRNERVKHSAVHAAIRLSRNGIPPEMASVLVYTTPSAFNGAYGSHVRETAVELYAHAFNVLDRRGREREIRRIGQEYVESIWEYKRLMGLQAFEAMKMVDLGPEAVQMVPPLLCLLKDRKELLRFAAAKALRDLRPFFSDSIDRIVQSALTKVLKGENDSVVREAMAEAQSAPRLKEEVEKREEEDEDEVWNQFMTRPDVPSFIRLFSIARHVSKIRSDKIRSEKIRSDSFRIRSDGVEIEDSVLNVFHALLFRSHRSQTELFVPEPSRRIIILVSS